MTKIYVPADGKRIVMPGNQPDWPIDGQPINPVDLHQVRMVRDGDLVVKTDTAKHAGKGDAK